MVRPGYAVEYDYFPPHQVDLTLETKKIAGLYFAGQVMALRVMRKLPHRD